MDELITTISNGLSDWVLIPVLIAVGIFMTLRTGGMQFTMVGEMIRQLFAKSSLENKGRSSTSSWQAFMISIASRVGTGNLAGVATAITLGGPGAVLWMWVIALIGAASAFIESTLAQIFKTDAGNGAFRGGPAYYIQKGLGHRWWAITFAVLISLTFGFAYNSVQSNTISQAFASSWHIDAHLTAAVVTILTLLIICGGLKSIARFSQWVVPIMAVAYIGVGLYIVIINIGHIPAVFKTIFADAFGMEQVGSGLLGSAMAFGIRRGLFSNEAGEGSTPNVAATANVSHPAKQGLVQALGVYTDTLIICTVTALIILLSGVYTGQAEGITLTQRAIDVQFGTTGFGQTFVSIAIFFFAFTSIVANYYYGETNIRFIISRTWAVYVYRLCVAAMVMAGGVASLETVWSLADVSMSLMALCNLFAIILLYKYAIRALKDYKAQKREHRNPVYYREVNPEIAGVTLCWPSRNDTPGKDTK